MAHQAEISGKTYEALTTFYAKQTQFPKSQMNVTPYNTTDYENKSNWTLGENKPKQTQFQIGRQKRNDGTFYAAHPTYIKEL